MAAGFVERLVADDLPRAGVFFLLTFAITALGGVLLGDLRLGLERGVVFGLVAAVFAYFFLEPTGGE